MCEQTPTGTAITHLECSRTGERFAAGRTHNLSTAGWPLLVRYDLAALKQRWDRDSLANAPASMWRYAPVLPVHYRENIVSLQEGFTPLYQLRRLGERLHCDDLWLKDEGVNPTGSFKARGLSCAVSMCRELGIRRVAIPTAGNAGGALAAYAAAAGLEAHVFMPRDVPLANYLEARAFGARVRLVDGLISDCGRRVTEGSKNNGWFEVSTLKEPYRIEGKKTMGFEAAEQFGWSLPDAIFYPTGGGVGMIGMWKAFAELEQLGWIGPKRPKMIAVQAEGCQPIVRAYDTGAEVSEFWQHASTVASGLRVPKALGDFLVLRAVRESGGAAVAVSDDEMMGACEELASAEGLFVAPEGGACIAALRKLRHSGFLKATDRILIYNTGTGYKYLEAFVSHFGAIMPSTGDVFAEDSERPT
ncbi:MAG TPA: threonine synthase [Bryobacteraceae bacterium]|nr:threonine synthase [Bryobacteraceae bacterium]